MSRPGLQLRGKKLNDNIRNLVILGSTGSIGRQAIEVVKKHPGSFRVIGLSARGNVELLAQQAAELNPRFVCAAFADDADRLAEKLAGPDLMVGEKALLELAAMDEVDIVLNALVGAAGLPATLAAVGADKTVALANKESLVAGGDLVRKALSGSKAKLIPVDSEHSAIFQCLLGEDRTDVAKIILTASGGPFRGRSLSDLALVTPEEAINHPRWRMGKKVSVDSATLINKGLEVIEAHYLFDLPYDRIEIIIHPQSIVHSLVEFKDGSLKAHLGPTDMRIPIQYALTYPKRFDAPLPPISLAETGSLNFEPLDMENSPCLKLALDAARQGKSSPAAMNAANEEAVAAFLAGRINILKIGKIIEAVLDEHVSRDMISLDIFKDVDGWARRRACEIIAAS